MENPYKKRRTNDLITTNEELLSQSKKLKLPYGTIVRTQPVYGIYYDTIKEEARLETLNRNDRLERVKYLLNEFNTIHTSNSAYFGAFGFTKLQRMYISLLANHYNVRQLSKEAFINKYSDHYPVTSTLNSCKMQSLLESRMNKKSNVRSIAKHLKVSYSTTRRYVKNTMEYKYVACSRINTKFNSFRNNEQYLAFANKYIELTDQGCIFLWQDESSFNSAKRTAKKWIHKNDKNLFFDNGRICGINIILTVSIDEIILNEIQSTTINSFKYGQYIDSLLLKLNRISKYYILMQ